jgi:hypothetical protein
VVADPHARTRGRALSLDGGIDLPPLPGVSTRALGYRFLHTLELFDDRMLLVDLDRGWLRLAA